MAPPRIVSKTPIPNVVVLALLDVVTTTMKAVAPLSATLLVFRLWAYATGRKNSIILSRKSVFGSILNTWFVFELMFFVYCQRVNKSVQGQPPEEKVVRLNKEARQTLIERCLQTSTSPEEFAESWYLSHHKFHDLKRDNIKEWLAWGLFHRHNAENDMTDDEKVELAEMVDRFEASCAPCGGEKLKIPDGYNAEAKLMKFSEEPVTHTHRPFVMYTIVHFIIQEILTPLRMSRLGFARQQHSTLVFHFRAGMFPEREPIVFIHGLGVGMLPYDKFLTRLVALTDDDSSSLYGRSILCVELHVVSQRLLPPNLHRDDFISEMREIMNGLGYSNGGIMIGHSYGSFAVSWLAQHASDLVFALGLFDPACLFLHYPNTLYSILYKTPTNGHERFMHFLIREELFFNAHARRHFFWYANIFFLEDFDTVNKPTMVLLSDEDFIVPVDNVRKYVENFNKGHQLANPKYENGTVDVTYLEKCDHGGFIRTDQHLTKVLAGIERLAIKASKMN
jgi:pimeloyl-ACP methyl ester carboxylesterase